MYSRNQRAETRNRAKDELKRVISSLDKVRKWEKRWVILKDTQIKMFKWVPVTAVANIPRAALKHEETSTIASGDSTRDSSTMDTNSVSRIRNLDQINEDSNMAFSEGGFDSDSNQTLGSANYTLDTVSTDFSAMREQEMVAKE